MQGTVDLPFNWYGSWMRPSGLFRFRTNFWK